MRVLHINGNYKLTTLHQLMIRQLTAIGIENQVFVPTYDKSASNIVPDDNVKIVECFKKHDRYWFEYKQNKIIKAVEEAFDIKSFDLIHAYTLFTDGNCARYLSQKYNIPYVVAVRNTDVNAFFKYRILLRKLGIKILEDADTVFFLTPVYRDFLFHKYVPVDKWGKMKSKSHIIPNGIDDFWHQHKFTERDYAETEKRLRRQEVRLVYAGSVDNNKNIKLTVAAMEKMNQEGWHVTLDVIGPIREENAYNDFKDNTVVRYVPKQPKEELIKYYRNADIFVMPSHHETFGLVYAEAMSQGLPVIYTRGQGFDQQFVEGVVGYSVNSNDVISLVKVIEKICNNYEIISKTCVNNIKKFEWHALCKEYSDIYKNILLYAREYT